MGYKWCVVSRCPNTSIITPEKMFVSIPKNTQIRKTWLMLARRNPKDIAESTNAFMCEDHFNIEHEMANYRQYKMGFSHTIIMVKGTLPSKFFCQEDHRKSVSDITLFRSTYVKCLKTDINVKTQAAAKTPETSTLKDNSATPETSLEFIAENNTIIIPEPRYLPYLEPYYS